MAYQERAAGHLDCQGDNVTVDIDGARAFLATHGRILDRRRLEAVIAGGATSGDSAACEAIISGLDLYRNADGGYGWGLEPDFRAAESQPQGAQHALEALVDAAPATSPHVRELLDWLMVTTCDDGGLPFALPVRDVRGCAPFFLAADPDASSLQATSIIAAHAYQLARHDPSVARHPWLATATGYCFTAIRAVDDTPEAHVLAFCLRFLDAAADVHAEAIELLEHLARFIPADGVLAVVGGAEGEAIHPLDYAPQPRRPVRRFIAPAAVDADLARVAAGQQQDGGWTVDFAAHSPAAAVEWRGYATVNAVAVLLSNTREPQRDA